MMGVDGAWVDMMIAWAWVTDRAVEWVVLKWAMERRLGLFVTN